MRGTERCGDRDMLQCPVKIGSRWGVIVKMRPTGESKSSLYSASLISPSSTNSRQSSGWKNNVVQRFGDASYFVLCMIHWGSLVDRIVSCFLNSSHCLGEGN